MIQADRATQDARPPTTAPVTTMTVVAAVLGNALEFFDFTVYSLFAVMIGRAFFPTETPFGQLLLSVGTFGVGFVTRPIGAVVLGAYADRAGRRAALTLTIVLMALGTGLLGLTPGYATIGFAAPGLVVLARLIQGFSVGGEVGAATSYLLEVAPAHRRGLYASWQSGSQGLAILVGSGIGYVLSVSLSADALREWGWRVPFILGLAIAPVGLYIRSRLPETQDAAAAGRSAGAVLSTVLSRHGKLVALSVFSIMGPTIGVYIIAQYMTTYAITVLHLPASAGMLAGLAGGCASVVAGVYGGWLSDRIGRQAVMVAPLLLLIAAIYPAFLFITRARTGMALLLMVCLMTLLRAMSSAVMLVRIPECFPRAVRSTGLSIAYGGAVTVFGGTTQLIVTWLIGVTGDPMAPAWYLIAANLASFLAVLGLRGRPDEMADDPIAQGAGP